MPNFAPFLAFAFSVLINTNANPADVSRIVNGNDANVGQFPYQVSFQLNDGFQNCGGSILNERFIVTAAHCVTANHGFEVFPVQFFQVRVGSIYYAMGGQLHKLKRIIRHEDYGFNLDLFRSDVALLELEKPLKWSEYIQPIELSEEEVPSGADVVVSGWGQRGNGTVPNRLQWTTLKALTTEECEYEMVFAHESIICLAHQNQNGACYGDSGGPAVYNGKLVGIFDFVVGPVVPVACATEFPDGYAKVSHFRNWILKHTRI